MADGSALTGRAALGARLISLLALLALWEAVARALGDPHLPAASRVFAMLWTETRSGVLPFNLAVTLARVAASFTLAMVLGTLLGLAMGRWRRLDLLLDSALIALLNVPALVVIVLLYIWFGLNEISAVAAVAINKLPATAVTIREGARAVDRGLLEMAASFHIGRGRTLRHIVLPQLAPYLFAAARSGLSLIWKIVLVVELLGRSNGVGFEIQIAFQLFDVTRILAYTLAFIIVVQLIEWGLLQPFERHVARWRR
ncbi:MAG TPA: ABC transporter permease subunit [Aliidongia sp.]|nr:ABC transporter permease subunit [Aliidongia sp.]